MGSIDQGRNDRAFKLDVTARRLAKTLCDIGRVERTLFALDWISDSVTTNFHRLKQPPGDPEDDQALDRPPRMVDPPGRPGAAPGRHHPH
jgi:hypothetical protein